MSRTIAQLSAAANEYEFDASVHLRYWIRSANAILRQARVYDDERAYADAYVLYLRYAQLVLNSLHTHPEARRPAERGQLNALSKKLVVVLARLQELKPIIEQNALEQAQAAQRRHQQHPQHPPKQILREREHDDVVLDLRGLGVADHPELQIHQSQSSQSSQSSQASPAPASQPSQPSQPSPSQPPAKQIEHKATARTEGGAALRTVFLPTQLRSTFLDIALPNTRKKLETCGILCGILNRNAFFITHLVIPDQESTSDTCSTKDEEALFNFLDEHELFTLGWIHTHPTQTCFLSSVDQHTQNSYQLMLAEAIAVVCAPMHEPSWGVFRLTDPPGIKAITDCRKPGMFHPHDERNIYTDAKMPAGHVSVRDGLPFKIVDLRPTL